MEPVTFAAALVLIGLAICFFSKEASRASTPFWWTGIVLAVAGLILLIARVVLWAAAHVKEITG